MKDIYCPNCGEKVRINEEKEFSFCTSCGFKIINQNKKNVQEDAVEVSEKKIDLEEKLEEVEFYYSLSHQKGEAKDKEKNPVYYLKGQDLLVELSKQFPDDYRIWWALSKPLDYGVVEEANDKENDFKFNEEYFNKALDYAKISAKKDIVEKREVYDNVKRKLVSAYEEKKKHIECEEKKRQKLEQEEYQRVQAEKEKQREEQEEKLANIIKSENSQIWEALVNGKYDLVDNTFFKIRENSEEKCIGTLKLISNVLYLNTFIENKIKNCIYYGQNFMVKFNANGELVHFDNKVIRKKDNSYEQSILRISSNGNGKLVINGNELEKNADYITWLMTNGKKTLFGNDKTLV